MIYPEEYLVQQRTVCQKYQTWFYPSPEHLVHGVSRTIDFNKPVTGIRHIPQSGSSGWFFFNEENFDPASFEPSYNLDERLIPYIGLPPGWAFKFSGDDEEAWFDQSLMNPEVLYSILDSRLPIISRVGWYLEDVFCLKTLQEDPNPFFLVPLHIDDIVRLNFVIMTVNENKEVKLNFEKMWVHVKEEEGGLYRGILDNDAACTDELKTGMELWFSPYHIDHKLEKE
ncbi:MAG: hypothetical protein ACK4ND_17645 [Cytophagaceae bacterium]